MPAPGPSLARLRRHARPVRVLGLALLLLWAQWAGLVHRLEHASRLPGASAPLAAAQGPVDREAEGAQPAEAYHSCVLFDGLHMADALPAVGVPLPAFTHGREAPQATRFVSWRAACVPPFLSRAPPLG